MGQQRWRRPGLIQQIRARMFTKYDGIAAAKILRWIRWYQTPPGLRGSTVEAVQKIPEDVQSVDEKALTWYIGDGLALGYLMACLKPELIDRVRSYKLWQVSSRKAFEEVRKRERMLAFVHFLEEFGASSGIQFQPEELYEKTGLAQVVGCLTHLGMEAQSRPLYVGPPNFWPQKL